MSMLLLSKLTVGGQDLKNRVILAPLTRSRGTPSEDPFDIQSTLANDTMKQYYTQRASTGLLITEAVAVSDEGYGWRNSPKMTTKEHALSWKKVVDAVHEKEGKIYIQLWHMGRQAHSSYHPTTNRTVSASNVPMVGGTTKTIDMKYVEAEVPHSLTIEEIKETVADFVHAAKLSQLAGFDGIEIHAANGYLIDQFLQSCSNQRLDEYGGSIENRARFLIEIVNGIVDSGAYPAERIGVRLAPNGTYGGMGSEDNFETFTTVAAMLNKFGLAYLHVLDGLGFGFHQKSKAVTASDIRKVLDGSIFCNVGLTKEVDEGMIRSGACDGAVFGRLYMSNPDLVERFANDWPLEEPAPYETWYAHSAGKGYTDWPTYHVATEDVAREQ